MRDCYTLHMWAYHDVQYLVSFVMFTTYRIGMRNRPLKGGLLMKSTSFDAFFRVLRLTEELDEVKRHRIVKELLGGHIDLDEIME